MAMPRLHSVRSKANQPDLANYQTSHWERCSKPHLFFCRIREQFSGNAAKKTLWLVSKTLRYQIDS